MNRAAWLLQQTSENIFPYYFFGCQIYLVGACAATDTDCHYGWLVTIFWEKLPLGGQFASRGGTSQLRIQFFAPKKLFLALIADQAPNLFNKTLLTSIREQFVVKLYSSTIKCNSCWNWLIDNQASCQSIPYINQPYMLKLNYGHMIHERNLEEMHQAPNTSTVEYRCEIWANEHPKPSHLPSLTAVVIYECNMTKPLFCVPQPAVESMMVNSCFMMADDSDRVYIDDDYRLTEIR